MKTFEAVFYHRENGCLEQTNIQQECKSKAEMKRLAEATAKNNGWRLVEVREAKP